MNLNIEDLKKQYKINGFFVIKNFLNISPKILVDDILSVDSTERYYDKYSNLKRIEKLYNKSELLFKLNNDIIDLLENIFDEKMTIFKDKYNNRLEKFPKGKDPKGHLQIMFDTDVPNGEGKSGNKVHIHYLKLGSKKIFHYALPNPPKGTHNYY